MKFFKYLLLSAALVFVAVGCAVTRTEVTGSQPANSNAANTAAAPDATPAEASAAIESEIPQAGGAQQTAPPDAVVKDLYKIHDQDLKGNGERILNTKSRAMLDRFFDKTLAGYIWKDLTTHQDEVGVLDFDPFYNAQDFDIKNFSIGEPKIEGDRASVPVSFVNFDRKDKLTYSLVRRSDAAWKISDIKYTDGTSLLGYFKEDEKNNSAQKGAEEGMFAGTYQVGEATCTVKPVKMAFELKWAKGTGTMMFFYEGEGVLKYVSEDKGNGVDAFIFDDTTFTTGKFIRGSDGKQMAVRKIK
jgi:hypothetical protein